MTHLPAHGRVMASPMWPEFTETGLFLFLLFSAIHLLLLAI
jgi:hypothetical protein